MTGLLATVAGRQVFVPAETITEIEHGRTTLARRRLDLRPFERRPQEVLLSKDVLDRQLINVDGARLVRSNEIELARLDGWYRVVGVDVGLRGFARRLLPRALAGSVGASSFLDWASVEPFTGHVPTVRLHDPASAAREAPSGPARRSRRGGLAPRGRGDHRGGRRRPRARGGRVRGARVAATSSSSSRIDPTTRSAALIARMEADDAADLVGALPEERREPVLERAAARFSAGGCGRCSATTRPRPAG